MKNLLIIGLSALLITPLVNSVPVYYFQEDNLDFHKGAQVAVYVGPGTSRDGIIAFEHFLDWKGLTWEEVTYEDINQKNLSALYDVLHIPGGRFDQYAYYINENGTYHIRDLVSMGGGYIGICGGAYYASSICQWDDITFKFSLQLFNGTAAGPLWNEYFMSRLNMVGDHPINAYEPPFEWVLYGGGPAFYPNPGQKMGIIATYAKYNNEAAAISFEFGEGRVVLISPHPEIEEDSDRDGTDVAQSLCDMGSDWRLLWTCMDWVMGYNISRPKLNIQMELSYRTYSSFFYFFISLIERFPLFGFVNIRLIKKIKDGVLK